MNSTLELPFQRNCTLESIIQTHNSTILNRWHNTANLIERMQPAVQTLVNRFPTLSIFISGSVGRMEANSNSDLDCILIENSESIDPSIVHSVYELLIDYTGLRKSNSDGIFSKVVTWEQLMDRSQIGSIKEDPNLFGLRIQLLLDAQPITNDRFSKDAKGQLLTHYYVMDDSIDKENRFIQLCDDLMRYYYSLKVMVRNNQIVTRNENTKSLLKWVYSRQLAIIALFGLIKDYSKKNLSIETMNSKLHFTPLERLIDLLSVNDSIQMNISDLIDRYEEYLSWLTLPVATLPSKWLNRAREFNYLMHEILLHFQNRSINK